MICINATNSNSIGTYIRGNGRKIGSEDEMKILGFYFNRQPTPEKHIEQMEIKYRKRLWMLRNLKRAKIDAREILSAYCCFLRPVIEYCCNVYHSMLNISQSSRIENLQYSALKIIYGYDKTKTDLLELAKIPTLEKRRSKLFTKFCTKLHANQRFKKEWLPEREFEGPGLRNKKILIEKHASSSRLYNSPLYAIRRHLNDIQVK